MTMESTGAVGAGTPVPRAASADTPPADTSAPDTSAPDTSAPDTSAPDTSAPDTSAPETGRAGAAVPAPRAVLTRLGAAPRRRGQSVALVAADLTAAAATATVATVAGGSRAVLLGLGPVLVTLFALHQQGGLYRSGPSCTALGEVPRLLWRTALAWSAAAAVVAAVRPAVTVGWTLLLCLIAVHAALAAALRGGVHHVQRRRQRRNPRSALVVGAGSVARRVAAVLHEHPEYGMWPVGLVAPPGEPDGDPAPRPGGAERGAAGLPVPVLTATEDVTRAVVQNAVTDAVFTRRVRADPQTISLLRLFRALGCTVWQVDGDTVPGGATWEAADAGHVWGFPCVRLDPPRPRTAARAAKRTLDVAVAALALVAVAPVIAVCAAAVRLSDGRGVLFRQERVGTHGRPFVMLKFRTLRPTDAHESATRWNVAGDRRMSAVGRFLRRTSLDELPQLWNVLRGDMSLVGPRPERPYFVQQFSRAHPGYAARDRMPAGITGLAQINGLRGDTSIEDRARFDNHYIETWSFWQDVQILLRTAGSVFRLGGS